MVLGCQPANETSIYQVQEYCLRPQTKELFRNLLVTKNPVRSPCFRLSGSDETSVREGAHFDRHCAGLPYSFKIAFQRTLANCIQRGAMDATPLGIDMPHSHRNYGELVQLE